MTLSRDSVLALKRHFVGGLQVPSPLWLEPVPAPQVLLTSDALRGGLLDFGVVSSPGRERRIVRVTDHSDRAVTTELQEAPPWLHARWLASDELELTTEHSVSRETLMSGVIRLQVTDASDASRTVEIGVRMVARCAQPLGTYDFHGSKVPRPYDFANGAYELSFGNQTSVPLVLSFADLPSWLAMTVDGHTRHGPAPGKFFERAAPFRATIWARAVPGTHAASVRLVTNDPRPPYQSMELLLSATFEPASAFVQVHVPGEPREEVILENYGRSPARLTAESMDPAIDMRDLPVIPPAQKGRPGSATLPLRVRAEQLSPGTHTLFLALRVIDGEPPEITVPVQVNIAPGRSSRLGAMSAAELVTGAAAALLLIVWLFVAVIEPGL